MAGSRQNEPGGMGVTDAVILLALLSLFERIAPDNASHIGIGLSLCTRRRGIVRCPRSLPSTPLAELEP